MERNIKVIIILLCIYTEFGLAQRKGKNGTCEDLQNQTECCQGYWWDPAKDICSMCPKGKFGKNCTENCRDNFYGERCIQKCNCSDSFRCDSELGCVLKDSVDSIDRKDEGNHATVAIVVVIILLILAVGAAVCTWKISGKSPLEVFEEIFGKPRIFVESRPKFEDQSLRPANEETQDDSLHIVYTSPADDLTPIQTSIYECPVTSVPDISTVHKEKDEDLKQDEKQRGSEFFEDQLIEVQFVNNLEYRQRTMHDR